MPRAVVRWYSSTTTWPLALTFTPACSRVEQVTVGHSARRNQQRVAAHRRPVVATDLDAVADARASVTSWWLRISHFLRAMSVKRMEMSSSWPRNSVLPRIISVTRLPSAEKTCANSHATNPPPTMIRCSGSIRRCA